MTTSTSLMTILLLFSLPFLTFSAPSNPTPLLPRFFEDEATLESGLQCTKPLPSRTEVEWPEGYGPEMFRSTEQFCGRGVGCGCPPNLRAPRCDYWWGDNELQHPQPDSPGTCALDPASPIFRNPFGNLNDVPIISVFAAYCRRWCTCKDGPSADRTSIDQRPQPDAAAAAPASTAANTEPTTPASSSSKKRPPLFPNRSGSSSSLKRCQSGGGVSSGASLVPIGGQCANADYCLSMRQCAMDEGMGRTRSCKCATLVDEPNAQGRFPPMRCVAAALLTQAIRTGLGAGGGKQRLGGRGVEGAPRWACPCNGTFVAEACCESEDGLVFGGEHENLLKGRADLSA